MSAIYKSLSATQFNVARGYLLFAREGSTALRNVGSCMVTEESENEVSEVKTNEEPGRPIVYSDVVESNSTYKLTLMQLSPIMLAAALMSPEGEALSQTAVTAIEYTADGIVNDDIIELTDSTGKRVYDVTVASVEIGSVALPQDSYIVDKSAGRVQILKGAASPAEVTVTFSGAVIAATDGWNFYRSRQELNIRGRFVVRQNNARGVNREFWIPRASIRRTGAMNLISDSNDPTQVEFDLRIERDETQPLDRQYGFVVEYPKG